MIRINSKNKIAGHVVSFFSGVARIQGLSHVFLHEVLSDEDGRDAAIVVGFNEKYVEALFFNDVIKFDKPVFRTFRPFSISISDSLIGRVIDGLGEARDGLGKAHGEQKTVFQSAPQIIDRQPVVNPLTTGIKIIDTTLPLGRGQRELIIGDRKLGKTTIGVDTVLNQKHSTPQVYCVYVVCGQKEQKLREIISVFEKENAFLYTTVVAATAGDSFAAQYLAPFVGCTLAEYFRDMGKDALIVYDDLSQHAKSYRNISLLLERAPSRESYPGDIFYLHAALLERAAKLSDEKGGGSLTALPIIETEQGDIASFISTNLISITDGQIYLENGLFQNGFLPAVNIGLSVSRVGSQAQPKILTEIIGRIRLTIAQHKELQKLSQLETVVSSEAQAKIRRGDLILELLKQEKHTKVSWPEQVVLFYVVENGFFDDFEKEKWKEFEPLFLDLINSQYVDVLEEIKSGKFSEKTRKNLLDVANTFKHEFLSNQI